MLASRECWDVCVKRSPAAVKPPTDGRIEAQPLDVGLHRFEKRREKWGSSFPWDSLTRVRY